MLWLLVAVGLLVAGFAVRELLRHPGPTTLPGPLGPVPRGGDHTDWARAWDGLDGGGHGAGHGGRV